MEWKKPVITRVDLDPEQAILATCIANLEYGAWLMYGGPTCRFGTEPGRTSACKTRPRGSFKAGAYDQDNVPDTPGS